MNKHTPGPWVATYGLRDGTWRQWEITKADDDYFGIATAVGEADARLIAAAPDLLAVAEYALEVSDKWGALHQMATAAIAKARGET